MTPKRSSGPTGAQAAGLGGVLAAAVIVPLVAGIWLDKVLHTSPIFLFIGLFCGFAAAVAVFYVQFVRKTL
ncbi:MAG TPA: AtpZ/AtpI family protein [Candidatus Dormibacteraeota bacterium]|jgi:F0F1-type ATP synthase assembly protein I|nr:AtpZ/AtpI family protein [Candidatus Dormibacteraeota bacterium]